MTLTFDEKQVWNAVFGAAYAHFASEYDLGVNPFVPREAYNYAVSLADSAVHSTREAKRCERQPS